MIRFTGPLLALDADVMRTCCKRPSRRGGSRNFDPASATARDIGGCAVTY
jgi:hypothetical protein